MAMRLEQKFNYDEQLAFLDAPLQITSVKSEMETWSLLDVEIFTNKVFC